MRISEYVSHSYFVLFPLFALLGGLSVRASQAEYLTAGRVRKSCKSSHNWEKLTDRQWFYNKEILLTLFQETSADTIPSAYFWDTKNASEADSLLEGIKPGKEIFITSYLRRIVDSWHIEIDVSHCRWACSESPYLIHHLIHPGNDWVIDRLWARSKGGVIAEKPIAPFGRYTSVVQNGPHETIFEGRFKDKTHELWFSTLGSLHPQEKSTPKRRFLVFQIINDFFDCRQNVIH